MIARDIFVLLALLSSSCASAVERGPVSFVVLPSGCAEQNRHETRRQADEITVTVLNWMPAGSPPCTMIYGSYVVNINLGSDFRPGTTYTVSVNDKKTTFVAQ